MHYGMSKKNLKISATRIIVVDKNLAILASFSDTLLTQKTQKAVEAFLKNDPLAQSPVLTARLHKFQIDKIAKD